jgi:hypothetical protein
VINAPAGRYVWQSIPGNPTDANMRDVTPGVIPASLLALTVAVDPATQPVDERWEALYGPGPTYQQARVIGGVWIDADAGNEAKITSPDTLTYTESTDGAIEFVVDGNPVGGVVWDTLSGMPKWTLGGALDPIAYAGTPRTIAQRNALLPVAGWLVYIVDGAVNEYQMWNGAAWVSVGADLFRGSLASLAALTAMTTASLTAGQAWRVGDTLWVWDPTATASSGGIQPTDTAFPGVTPGYWVSTSGHYRGAYSTSAPYSANDIVFHGGALWRANSAREAGVWGAAPIEAPSGFNSWTRVTSPVKGPFSSAQSYALGDVVYDASGLIGPVPGLYRADAAFTAGALPDMDTWSPLAVRPIYRGDYGAAEYAVGDVVHYLGGLYRCVVAHGSNSFGGPFTPANWSLLSADPSWEFSTNNIQTVAGHWYIIDGAHTVLMPVAPVNGASVQFASPVEWSTRGATFTAAGATTVGAGQTGMFAGFDVIEMTYSATGDNWVVHVGSGSAPQADTIENLNATGTVTAWGSVVVIGATAPTANMILTLPVAAGNTGKTIKLVRVDNTAFTVTLAAQGDTATLISAGSELNTQYGSLTLEATAATEIRQVAQVSAGGTTLYAGDGTISGVRTVNHDNLIRFVGSGPTGGLVGIHNEGFVDATGFQLSASADHPTGAAPTYTPGQNNLSVMSVDALSTGIITVAIPTQIVGTYGASVATIQVRNDDTITRTVAWHADYLGFDGTTPMTDITVAAGSNRTFTFHETIRTGATKYTLVADTSGISGTSGASGADTVIDINTSIGGGRWNEVIVIGAVTPPTANMTIILPLIVTPGLSNIGKTIKIVRADNTAFTVTLATQGGINLSVFNGASELNTQNGSITLEATSADHIRQVAQVAEQAAPVASPVASFLRGSRSTGQSVAAGNAVVFTSVDSSAGTDISLNTTTGHITLKAGKTYRLVGSANTSTTTAQRSQWRWNDVTAGGGGIGLGAAQVFYAAEDAAGNSASGSPATAIISPTVDTIVRLQLASTVAATAGGNTDFGAGASVHPWFEVEVIGGQESAVVVPATPLHVVSIATSTPDVNAVTTVLTESGVGGYFVPNLTDPMLTKFDPNGMISGNKVVIQQAGRYRLAAGARVTSATPEPGIRVNGIYVATGDHFGSSELLSYEAVRSLSVGDIVDFTITASAAASSANGFYLTVEQLPASTVVDPGSVPVVGWASYPGTIGGVTTAPTPATGTAPTARFRVVGKTLSIQFRYYAGTSGAGSAIGAGVYSFPLPAGYTINTAVAPIPAVVSTASGTALDVAPLGFGTANSIAYNAAPVPVFVVPISTTAVGLVLANSAAGGSNGMVASTQAPITGANTGYAFTCDIPIL